MSALDREIRRQMQAQAQEANDLAVLERDLMAHHQMLEQIGLAVVRAVESGEDQQVPGIRIHGVPLHVHVTDIPLETASIIRGEKH